MPTLPQLLANQQNAQLSTGPTSSKGKAKSSLNSLKHSIFSKDVLAQEDEQAALSYQEFKKGVFESLHPQNQLQASLAEKIAVDMWRLRKVLRFESGAIAEEQKALDNIGSDCSSNEEDNLKAQLRDLKGQLLNARKTLSNVSKKGVNLKKIDEGASYMMQPIITIITAFKRMILIDLSNMRWIWMHYLRRWKSPKESL